MAAALVLAGCGADPGPDRAGSDGAGSRTGTGAFPVTLAHQFGETVIAYGTVSAEQLDVIDTDVVIWDQLAFIEGGRRTVEADPLVAQLSSVQEGRVVWLDGDVEDAFGWQTVLSIPFALDGITADLDAAAANAAPVG